MTPVRISGSSVSGATRPSHSAPTARRLLWSVVLLLVGLGFAACEGPTGPEGPQGLQGEQGAVGPAGEDGSTIHAGDGPPSADVGVEDDYYLDRTAAELYGPKTAEGWGTPITLRGPAGEDGQDGTDGSQIYAGEGPPDGGIGVVGDYYLDKASYDLYGPKTTSGWGDPLNLQATTNVMYSVWTDITWGSDDSDTYKDMLFLEDRISLEFMNQGGVVLMQLKREGFPTTSDIQIFSLPREWANGEMDFLIQNRTTLDSGRILFTYISSDANPLPDVTYMQVRYILIPGAVQLDPSSPLEEYVSSARAQD